MMSSTVQTPVSPDSPSDELKTLSLESYQFSPSLIPTTLSIAQGFTLRPLSSKDYQMGYLDLLSQLTTVGNVTEEMFRERFEWLKSRNDVYFVVVLEDTQTGRIAGTGTVLVEHKFIHQCGKVGHIEDIVVDSSYRGKNLGRTMIEALKCVSESVGCYKTILCCAEKNVPFYEKCGLKPKEISMAVYFPGNDQVQQP